MGPVTKKPHFDPTPRTTSQHGTQQTANALLVLLADSVSNARTCAPSLARSLSLALASSSLFSSLSPPRTVSSPRNGSCRTGRTEWGRNHSEPSHCARARQSWRCCTTSAVAWQLRRRSMTREWNRVRAPSRGSEGCYGARARSAPDSPRSGAAGGSPGWRGRGQTWS